MSPVITMNPEAITMYWWASLGCRAVTAEKTSTADADVPATTSWRLVPKMAYSPSEASRVYRPACGGSPARPA